jgi:dienelactone hydrolase
MKNMAALILLFTLLVEISFTAFCLMTNSEQKKARNMIRLLSLGVFAICSIASVLEWGLRWYGLGLLLSVWSVISIISLIRGSRIKREFSRGRTAGKSIGILLLVTLTLIPAFIFPQFSLPKVTGEYEVATASAIWTDPSREERFTAAEGDLRFVNVAFWYPADYDVTKGKCPLIVFSHGAYGIKGSNTSTYQELASHGYVVCSVDHPYHAMFTKSPNGGIITADSGFMKEIAQINDEQYPIEAKGKIIQEILSLRVDDINFVLDQIGQMASTAGAEQPFAMIDMQKLGLMGHSLGGAAAAEAAKEREDIRAVVNLDGDFLGEYVYEDGKESYSLEPYSKPILCFWSDLLYQGISGMGGFPFLNQAPDSYEVHIKGTNHMSYTDLPYFSPLLNNSIIKMSDLEKATVDQRYCTETMNNLILRFLNCYIKQEGNFEAAVEY